MRRKQGSWLLQQHVTCVRVVCACRRYFFRHRNRKFFQRKLNQIHWLCRSLNRHLISLFSLKVTVLFILCCIWGYISCFFSFDRKLCYLLFGNLHVFAFTNTVHWIVYFFFCKINYLVFLRLKLAFNVAFVQRVFLFDFSYSFFRWFFVLSAFDFLGEDCWKYSFDFNLKFDFINLRLWIWPLYW